jgi:hypothetical protein
MELEIGGIYEMVSEFGTRYVVRITEDDDDRYNIMVLENGNDKREYSGHLFKDGRLLKHGTITRLDKAIAELKEAYQKGRKRTPVEIEIDNLIEHVQRNIKLNQLWDDINKALDTGDVDTFVKLSKEYAKLKKKVTA